jgi:predicted nucleic acid-binding protein
MTALVFVDTNVLLYARDPRDRTKQTVASDWLKLLWREERGRTSTQVLSEYYDTVTRGLRSKVSPEDAWEDVQIYMATWKPQVIDVDVLRGARDLEVRYRLSWRDCLVVAAAQAQHCVLLLSEDLQDGADYGGVVVRSPFTLRIAEESGAYAAAPRLASRHRGRGRPRRPARPAGSAG